MEIAAEAKTTDPPVPPSVLASDEVSEENTPETGRTALARFATEDFLMAAKAKGGCYNSDSVCCMFVTTCGGF